MMVLSASFILVWILIHVINVRSSGWTFRYFGQTFVVTVVVALVMGVYPA